MHNKGQIESIIATLKENEDLRLQVIRQLATEFPKDFLSPVKIQTDALSSIIGGTNINSCKEWQE